MFFVFFRHWQNKSTLYLILPRCFTLFDCRARCRMPRPEASLACSCRVVSRLRRLEGSGECRPRGSRSVYACPLTTTTSQQAKFDLQMHKINVTLSACQHRCCSRPRVGDVLVLRCLHATPSATDRRRHGVFQLCPREHNCIGQVLSWSLQLRMLGS